MVERPATDQRSVAMGPKPPDHGSVPARPARAAPRRAAGRPATAMAAGALALSALLAARPASASAQAADRAPDPDPRAVFELREAAPGVWAALVREGAPAYAFANSLVLVTDDGVLVVDTQQSPPAARALIALVRELTDRPVRWVVNTHWHADHVAGNEAYARAFPGVVFHGHPRTRERVLADGPAWREEEIHTVGASLARVRERLEGGGATGEPLPDSTRAALEAGLAVRRAHLDALEDLALIGPEVTFDRALTLWPGGREVRLLHPGPAHTAGDVVVWLPAEGVLAAGDLVEAGLPYVLDESTPAGWAAALDRLAALDVRHLLPAHGSLVGRALLDRQRDLLRAVAAEAWAARAEGASEEEALDRVLAAATAAVQPGGADPDAPSPGDLRSWVERVLPLAWRELPGAAPGPDQPQDPTNGSDP